MAGNPMIGSPTGNPTGSPSPSPSNNPLAAKNP